MTKQTVHNLVNWHDLWKTQMSKCSTLGRTKNGGLKQWTIPEAERFLKKSNELYLEQVLDKINASPDDDILDIGCGPGNLTLPLAKVAHTVTAVDSSSGMLTLLKRRADELGLDNIHYKKKFWRKIVPGKDIKKKYSIVISSNSLNLLGANEEPAGEGSVNIDWNLIDALSKIDEVGERIYVTMPLLEHTKRDMFQQLGREHNPFPSYIIVYNVMYQMGLRPNVDYLTPMNRTAYKLHNYLESLEWMLDLNSGEKEKMQEYISEHQDKLEQRTQVWAMLWWTKK